MYSRWADPVNEVAETADVVELPNPVVEVEVVVLELLPERVLEPETVTVTVEAGAVTVEAGAVTVTVWAAKVTAEAGAVTVEAGAVTVEAGTVQEAPPTVTVLLAVFVMVAVAWSVSVEVDTIVFVRELMRVVVVFETVVLV